MIKIKPNHLQFDRVHLASRDRIAHPLLDFCDLDCRP